MAKKKKVVITTTKKASTTSGKSTLSPTTSKKHTSSDSRTAEPFLFGNQNFMLLGAGALVMAIGFILMLGGNMPDANTWDEDIIYGFRRTVLAPFMLFAGLITLIFAIFKKQPEEQPEKPQVANKNL